MNISVMFWNWWCHGVLFWLFESSQEM